MKAYHILGKNKQGDRPSTCVVAKNKAEAIKKIEKVQYWKRNKIKVRKIFCMGKVEISPECVGKV